LKVHRFDCCVEVADSGTLGGELKIALNFVLFDLDLAARGAVVVVVVEGANLG